MSPLVRIVPKVPFEAQARKEKQKNNKIKKKRKEKKINRNIKNSQRIPSGRNKWVASGRQGGVAGAAAAAAAAASANEANFKVKFTPRSKCFVLQRARSL